VDSEDAGRRKAVEVFWGNSGVRSYRSSQCLAARFGGRWDPRKAGWSVLGELRSQELQNGEASEFNRVNIITCYCIVCISIDSRRNGKTSKDIQGLGSMAKGPSIRSGDLFAHGEFPRSEIYCLTSQMRRAAISIPANIAEGFKKRGSSDKTRYLNVAQGSLEECRYYLILVEDLGYGSTAHLEALLGEVSKLLLAYASAIEANRRSA
jgi:four helix bundle protein